MSSNPRRTVVTRQSVAPLKTNMVLRKGATFHSPTTPSSSSDETDTADFRPPRLPQRSQTNLDDVIDSHRRRVAMTLGHIDRALTASPDTSSSALSGKKFRDHSLPIPQGILTHNIDSSIMSKTPGFDRRILRPRPRRTSNHHDSDSGLGTSIATTTEKCAKVSIKKEMSPVRASAITRSAAARSATENHPPLSARATNRIFEHTLKPLLGNPSFKDFHSLLLECPPKIQKNDIVCLRDVERLLLLAAPERTKSASLRFDFSMATIRCIQATVEYLSDQEQTRPRDLPYTSGYFIDLVDQIMQYSKQLADAGDKGKDEMDLDRTDPVKLHGGFDVNGRPAALVRIKKNGQAISLATGEPVDILEEESKGAMRIKRSASQELEDEEEIMRSMARRKKNASPEELAPKRCSEPGCSKQFSRSCDLTKHEKTHSRPWKCPVATCKYREYGWPTEKERDRHHNDKHSANPAMYECKFEGCAYKSKRDSNRKQHMEKAHGWTYVRTKTNPKKSGVASVQGSNTEPTPQLQNIPTPPSDHSIGVATPPDDHFGLFNNNNNNIEFPSYIPHDTGFDMIPQDLKLDYSPDNGSPFSDPGLEYNNTFSDIGNDFTLMEDIYSATAQIPTPTHDVYSKQFPQQFTPFPGTNMCQPQPASHISPIGHGNAMLFTPTSLAEVEEGFDDCHDFGADKNFNPGDFVLFPGANTPKSMFDPPFVGEIPSLAGGYSQPNSQDLMGGMMLDWSDFKNF